MTPDQWAKLEPLFEELLGMSVSAREARLERLRASEPTLAAYLAQLLETAPPASFLERPDAAKDDPGETTETFPEFSNYRVIERIGSGGMGTVYRAEQLRPRRIVALKVLRGGVGPSDEADVLASLRHEGIVNVYEVGHEHGRHFFSMELVDGMDLAQAISQVLRDASKGHSGGAGSPLPAFRARGSVRQIGEIGVQIADALAAAHRMQTWHGDVKPSNILVTSDRKIKLVDFGIASARTSAGVPAFDLFGAPPYMSPERLRAQLGRVDHRTDVYSLGVVLYELLTLRRPFVGRTNMDVVRTILSGARPPSLRSINPLVPTDLQTIVDKAMSPDPDDRYQSMGDLRDDLLRFLANEAIVGRPESLPQRARKWFVRHRVTVFGALGMAGAIALSAWGVQRANINRERRRLDELAGPFLVGVELQNRPLSERRAAVELVRGYDAARFGEAPDQVAHLGQAIDEYRREQITHLQRSLMELQVAPWTEQEREGRRAALLAEALDLRVMFPEDPEIRRMASVDAGYPRIHVEAVNERGSPVASRVYLASVDPVTTAPGAPEFLGASPIVDRALAPGYYRLTIVFEEGGFREVPCHIGLHRMRSEFKAVRTLREASLTENMVELAAAEYHWPQFTGHPLAFAGARTAIAAFWIDRCEVSNGEYRAFLEKNPEHTRPFYWGEEYDASLDPLPVTAITWSDAADYALWLGKRLPTLAEWLYAACGAEGRPVPWSSSDPTDLRRGNVNKPRRVAQSLGDRRVEYLAHVAPACGDSESATPNGIGNMYGNVEEWTESQGVSMSGGVPVADPKSRLFVGAAWDAVVAERLIWAPTQYTADSLGRSYYVGFRCAKSAAPPIQP